MEQVFLLVALAFSPANIVATVLLLVVVLYWLLVVAGLFDMHFLDGSADGHVDADGHADTEGHADGAGKEGTSGSAFKLVLGFIGGVETPAAITLSFFILLLWSLSLTVNHILRIESFLLSSVLLVPVAIASAVIAKIVTWPLRRFFASLAKQTEQFEEIMGRIATVTTSTVDEKFGQVRIETGGAPITLNARTEHGEIIERGGEVIVVGYDKQTGIAVVHKP